MVNRCTNPNDVAFKYYGGLGITVCAEWIVDYDQFYADMGERPPDGTLDRRDSEKGYCLDNCRWATMKEQLNNQRRTIWITHEGKTLTLSQWAEELKVPYYTLWNRIRAHKMEPAKALVSDSLSPVRRHGTNSMYAGGCRCKECVSAGAAYRKGKRDEQTA